MKKNSVIQVGIIGCGQWGPNHIRNFSHSVDSQALMCSDLDEKRLKAMKDTFLNIEPTPNYQKILKDPRIQAVCISTPTKSHYKIAKEALAHDKDVLCEKPLTLEISETEELIRIAEQKNRILMVGHVFLFNPGIQKLKSYLSNKELGKIEYAHSSRTNLGPFRYDVNALWDLAPHDISIFNYLFDSTPVEVSARGHRCLSADREDLVFVNALYPDNIFVNIHVSWLDPKKIRTITIVGDRKMVAWDDLGALGPIQLYDKHVEKNTAYYETFGEFQLKSKEGDVTIPKIDMWEPLKAQDAYFIDCVKKRKNPDFADGQRGLDVIRVLHAAQASIQGRGKPVKIEPKKGRRV